MTAPTLAPAFAVAVEQELAALGSKRSKLERNERRARVTTGVIGSVIGAGVLTGGALLTLIFPGHTTTTPVGGIVSGSYTGTATIDLGAAPVGTSAVILDVTCIEGGTMGKIEVPLNGVGGDLVSWSCDVRKDTVHIKNGKLPGEGSTSITITADPGTRWDVAAQYATTSITEWGVNENGQTYGEPNENGNPDLVPARATNGEVGYVFFKEKFLAVEGTIMNVYESDGETIIGQFYIGST
jgi:hypothetical protein